MQLCRIIVVNIYMDIMFCFFVTYMDILMMKWSIDLCCEALTRVADGKLDTVKPQSPLDVKPDANNDKLTSNQLIEGETEGV